jgi:uncharacterized protein YndB with AHSA1/START domain
MPVEFIRLSSPLPAPAERVYAAWLDSREHSRMTGGAATVDPKVGGHHTAWDGYIEGEILELEPGRRIVQTWRSSQFPPAHPHSRLEIRLRDVPGGCEIMLAHSEIPEGQGEQYEKGWHEHYFIPMTKYFRGMPEEPVTVPLLPTEEAKKPAKAKKAPKAKKAAKPRKAAAAKRAPKKGTPAKRKPAAGAKKKAAPAKRSKKKSAKPKKAKRATKAKATKKRAK